MMAIHQTSGPSDYPENAASFNLVENQKGVPRLLRMGPQDPGEASASQFVARTGFCWGQQKVF